MPTSRGRCRASSTATAMRWSAIWPSSRASAIRKYANTFYHLEPNVKETPGGLRDYQLVCWLDQLRQHAILRAELDGAFLHFAQLRCFLH